MHGMHSKIKRHYIIIMFVNTRNTTSFYRQPSEN